MGPIGWLVAIGFGAIGAALAIWGFTDGNRMLALWLIGIPGAFCLVIAGGFEVQKFAAPDKPTLSEAEIRQLRAYFTLTKIVQVPAVPEVDKLYEIKVEFRNTGKSPARKHPKYTKNT